MANTFKNASANIGTSSTDIYTCPANTSAVVFTLYFSNIDGVNPADVTIEVYDGATQTVGLALPVPVGSTLEFGKIALEAGDVIRAKSTTAGDILGFCNVLEIT